MSAAAETYATYGWLQDNIRWRWRLARRRGISAALSGAGDVRCNVCNFDRAFDRGFVCPRCKSGARHRLIRWFLENERPDLLEGARMLHFAPERSLGAWLRCVGGLRYETADLCARGVDHHLDITRAIVSGDAFDLVMANHILEHIPDDRAALANIFRMVRPGGLALITVPVRSGELPTDEEPIADPAERKRRYGSEDHVRHYGRDLTNRMTEAGFETVTWSPPASAPVKELAMGGELLFLGTKPLP